MPLEHDLRRLLGADAVLAPARSFHHDATESRALEGVPEAVVRPRSAEEVAAVVAFLYERGVAIVPRGGGTGFSGGAVPVDGGVVVDTSALRAVRSLRPELWRIEVEAGLPTAHLRRLAREHGLMFPPDPGAAESSLVGGNLATNAGGPHAFGHGPVGDWVTGIEAVLAPGELVRIAGSVRKDVAAYDLRRLLVGSEGTLGIITAATLRLAPAPEATVALGAELPDPRAGQEAVLAVLGSGLWPAALEFLDGETMRIAGAGYPGTTGQPPAFVLLSELEGSAEEVERGAVELGEVLAGAGARVHRFDARQTAALWRWRGGVSLAVTARLGGKVSEDIGVPVDRLAEAVQATRLVGEAHGLPACSWGHAGDGNLHSTFMLDPSDRDALARAERAGEELFSFAASVGGTISGEHGIGVVKAAALRRELPPGVLVAHRAIKQALDPRGLMNPGKKA